MMTEGGGGGLSKYNKRAMMALDCSLEQRLAMKMMASME